MICMSIQKNQQNLLHQNLISSQEYRQVKGHSWSGLGARGHLVRTGSLCCVYQGLTSWIRLRLLLCLLTASVSLKRSEEAQKQLKATSAVPTISLIKLGCREHYFSFNFFGSLNLYYLPLLLVDPEFLLYLPVILQEKYPSSKPLRIGTLYQ